MTVSVAFDVPLVQLTPVAAAVYRYESPALTPVRDSQLPPVDAVKTGEPAQPPMPA